MMELEQQVCSLELAKRLKELGVKQESLFWWINTLQNNDIWKISQQLYMSGKPMDKYNPISAFTVAELGEMLPKNHFNFYKNEDGYLFSISGRDITDKSEANARAKMLIYLLENKLIKP